MSLRIGHGYDIHRTAPGRALVLGGVRFEADFGLLGHSDADCLTHAICDAFLGAAGLPDIGNFFPDTDPQWSGVDSQILLRRVIEMKAALAASTGLPSSAIGVKATTNEGTGDLGRGVAIAAHAVALIEKA